MSFYQTTLFKLKKFTCSFGFAALFFFLLSTVSFSYNFVVCSRHPFGSLVKFKLWNLTIFKNSIVVLWLSGKSSMFVFVFAKKLTCISLAIMLIPWLLRNTRLAYALDVFFTGGSDSESLLAAHSDLYVSFIYKISCSRILF